MGKGVPLDTRTRTNQAHFAMPKLAQQDLIIALGK